MGQFSEALATELMTARIDREAAKLAHSGRAPAPLARESARFGEDSPGIPGIILTHDPSPGAGDLKIHAGLDIASPVLGRARRGLPIFVTGGKASAVGYPQGFFPVTVPQAFDINNAQNGIGQVSGFVAANLVQLPSVAPAPIPNVPSGPAPSPGPVGPAGPPKLPPPPPPPHHDEGPSALAIGAGIGGVALMAAGAAVLLKAKKKSGSSGK